MGKAITFSQSGNIYPCWNCDQYESHPLLSKSKSSDQGTGATGINQPPPSGNISALPSSCEKLPVKSISAIGSDGHILSNIIDNNLNTRWSNRVQDQLFRHTRQLKLGRPASFGNASADLKIKHAPEFSTLTIHPWPMVEPRNEFNITGILVDKITLQPIANSDVSFLYESSNKHCYGHIYFMRLVWRLRDYLIVKNPVSFSLK